jgi:hypothetical protein
MRIYMHTISSKYVNFFGKYAYFYAYVYARQKFNKNQVILLKHVEQLLSLIKHNVDTTWVCTYSALNCLFTNKEEN